MILFRCLIESKYLCVQVSNVLESTYTFYCPSMWVHLLCC